MARYRAGAWNLLGAAAVAASLFAAAQAQGQPPPPPPKAAPAPENQGLRNVTVLKGLTDVLPTMHVMRAALGVTCDYCHVAELNQYWRDDKPAKLRAREMMLMVAEINRANFGGRQVVTCNTCHRGSPHPVNTPAIGQGAFADTTHALPEPAPAPSTAQVLAGYVKAVGGAEKLQALTRRTARITLLRSVPIPGAVPPQVKNRGEAVQVETAQQLPDRYVRTLTAPAGVQTLLVAGGRGWIASPQVTRSLSVGEIERVMGEWQSSLELGRELDLQRRLASSRPARRDAIDGKPVYVVTGPAADGRATERLYFDAASGLLVRRIVLRPTQAGPDPEQTDYADYRSVGAVQLPFRITTSYLDDNHLGVTRIYRSVRDNGPLDAHAFDPPAAAPAAPAH